MVQSRELAVHFETYGDWRNRVAESISALHAWLKKEDFSDAATDLKVRQLLERLHQDKLVVAFVAESARGKSELINAILFADSGQRLLPTTPSRTTMCPTELLYDATRAASIRLLPIETRLKDTTVSALRNYTDEWFTFPLNLSDARKMSEALARVSEVKRVSPPLARALGLRDDEDGSSPRIAKVEDSVEIPRWRHAIINFPHPLLRQGLVILDTPGLNVVGTEPELMLNLLPTAHVTLFVLAADAGVTQTDLAAWTRVQTGADPGEQAARMVVLNKIDTLWGEMKPEAGVAAEIDHHVAVSASLLGLPRSQIYPVSAQKGLLAKVNGDARLLDKSHLLALEDALSRKLLAVKRRLVGAATQAEVRALVADVSSMLKRRRARIAEQLVELRELRAKNEDVVSHMMARVREEKESFEHGAQRFTALRTVFTQQTNALFDVLGLEALRSNAGRTRQSIERSTFTKGVRNAMTEFFRSIRRDFEEAERRSTEIHDMMQAMYTRFSADQGIDRFEPPPFAMLKYGKEIDRIEHAYDEHFNTLWNMLSKAKFSLTQRFFETVTSRVKHVYDIANRDIESWLRAVMSPLETRIADRHAQLRRRLESVKRIHTASGEIEEHITDFQRQHEALAAQLAELVRATEALDAVVLEPDVLPVTAHA